jgi:hypothetical protein
MANGTWVFIPTASSVLIGQQFYQPSTDPAYAAGTSFADVDAANVFVAFTPITPAAIIVASFACDLSGDGSQATDLFRVNLRDISGNNVSNTQQIINKLIASNQGAIYRATCYWSLTGLTGGQPYTYRRGFAKSDTHLTARIHAGDDSANGWGPITMLAYTA